LHLQLLLQILLKHVGVVLLDLSEIGFRYLGLWNEMNQDLTLHGEENCELLLYLNFVLCILCSRSREAGLQLASIPLLIESVQEISNSSNTTLFCPTREFVLSARLLHLCLLDIVQTSTFGDMLNVPIPSSQNLEEHALYGLCLGFYLKSNQQNPRLLWLWCRNQLSALFSNSSEKENLIITKVVEYCLYRLTTVSANSVLQFSCKRDDCMLELIAMLKDLKSDANSLRGCIDLLDAMVITIKLV
jgi:hypothetical protein